VMPSPRAAEIVLTDVERAELVGWTRRRKSAAGLALRARIVLAAADGGSNVELADRLELDRNTVSKWRNRFVQFRLDGLLDEPRPGRPRVVGDERIKDLITATLESAPADATHWSDAVDGRASRVESVDGLAGMAGVRIGSAQTGFVETVQGSAVRGEGP
jgi:transposase-like protein